MKIIQLMALLMLGLCAVQSTAAAADYWKDNQCPLDVPKPILKNESFKLDKEKGVATEHMQLDQSVDLDIEMGGCEYVSRSYIFTVRNKIEGRNVVGVEYRTAIELLTRLEDLSDIEFMMLAEAKKALLDYMHLVVTPQQNVDIYVGESRSDILTTVNIKADLEAQPAIIHVNISSGPY